MFINHPNGKSVNATLKEAHAINPYSNNEAATMSTYTDSCGYEYWIDNKTGKLIQLGETFRGRLPIKELRAIAKEALDCAGITTEACAKYHPLEDNRNGEIYFFRWDDFAAPAKEDTMPPFVQVGISQYGQIVSFTNTL